MLYFAEGVHANIQLGQKDSLVASVQSFGKVKIPAADSHLLRELMLGLDDEMLDDPRLASLRRYDFMTRKKSMDDAVIAERLAAMGEKWSWQRPTGMQGKRYDKLLKASLKVHAMRKVFVQDFGQTPCQPETAVRRALLAGSEKKKILLIGDDDLLSIPLAMLGHEVTVYDIDDAILLPFLRYIAKAWKLPIRALHVDLMRPQKKRGGFDLMYTDPMSTRECFDLFLSRGFSWLKPKAKAFCCVHAYAYDTFEAVQRDMGFGLAARHRDFNHYYEEGFWENYYQSDLVELDKLTTTKAVYALSQDAPLDLTAGELNVRHHQAVDIRAFDPKHFDLQHVQAAVQALKAHALIEVSAEVEDHGDNHLSYVAALKGGGSLALTAYFDEQLIAYDLYPYQPSRDAAIRHVIRQTIPHIFHKMIYRAARVHSPDLRIDKA